MTKSKLFMFMSLLGSSALLLACDAGGCGTGGFWSQMTAMVAVGYILFTAAWFMVEGFVIHHFLHVPFGKAVWRAILLGLWTIAYMMIPMIAWIVFGLWVVGLYNHSPLFAGVLRSYSQLFNVDGLVALFHQVQSGQGLEYIAIALVALLAMWSVMFMLVCYVYRRHIDPAVDRKKLHTVVLYIMILRYLLSLAQSEFLSYIKPVVLNNNIEVVEVSDTADAAPDVLVD